jgi:hypothetical protein
LTGLERMNPQNTYLRRLYGRVWWWALYSVTVHDPSLAQYGFHHDHHECVYLQIYEAGNASFVTTEVSLRV